MSEPSREELVVEAEAAWPGVSVPRPEFERWLDAHLEGEDPAERSIDELYLTCACAREQPAALTLFEERYIAELDVPLERFGTAVADEAKQLVRVKLFGPDKVIGEYKGRGDLRGWLKVLAVRTALGLLRREKGTAPLEEGDALAPIGADAELEYLHRRYTHQLKAALQASFEKLEVRERNLLRQHLVDRLNIDQIGNFYRVNRVTAYRWITAAREKLIAQTRERLARELRLDPNELDSLFKVVDSRVDLSLQRLFKSR